MTRNNLDKHLSWLLNRGSSLLSGSEKARLLVPIDYNQSNGDRGNGEVVIALPNQQRPSPRPTAMAQRTSVQSIFARSRGDISTANAYPAGSDAAKGSSVTALRPTDPSTASRSQLSSTTDTTTNIQTASTSISRRTDVSDRDQECVTVNKPLYAPHRPVTPKKTIHKETLSTRTNANTRVPFSEIAAIDLTGGPSHGRRMHSFEDNHTKRPSNRNPALPATTSHLPVDDSTLHDDTASITGSGRQPNDPMPDSEADEIFDNLTPSDFLSDPPVAPEVIHINNRPIQPSTDSLQPVRAIESSSTNVPSSEHPQTPTPQAPLQTGFAPLQKSVVMTLQPNSVQESRQLSSPHRNSDFSEDKRSYAPSTTSTPSLQLPLTTKQVLDARTGHQLSDKISSHHSSTGQSGDDAAIKQFLQMNADTMDDAIAKLRAISLENSNKIFELTIDLNCENPTEMRTQLMEENKIISAKISAIESLKMPKQAHINLSERQRALRDKIVELASRDPGLLEQGRELQEARTFAKRIRDLETQMLQIMKEAGLLGDFLASSGNSTKSGISDDPYNAAAILITGTPHPLDRQNVSQPGPAPVSPTPLRTRSFPAEETDDHVSKRPRLSNGLTPALSPDENLPDPVGDDEFADMWPVSYDETFNDDHQPEEMWAPAVPDVIDPDEEENDLLEDLHRSNGLATPSAIITEPLPSRQPLTDIGNHSVSLAPPASIPIQSSPMMCKTENRNAPPPGSISSLHGHPWSKDVKAAMRDIFRLKGFRPHQLEAINTTLSGKDTFVLMPTGGGKSLCYQLPATIKTGKTHGVTIVISPLLSLMDDQVAHLRSWNIKAFVFNGEMPKEDRRYLLDILREDDVDEHIQLLYVTPEMMGQSNAFEDRVTALYNKNKLARIVIDEAHCVSQWGHDFRPEYKTLGSARQKWPRVPLMALTATATDNVKADVISNLNMQGCEVFAQSFNRPNLVYEIRPKGKKADSVRSIAELIKSSYNDKSGIVYCLARKRCEEVAKSLKNEFRIKASHYHAGMPTDEKTTVQKKWQDGRIKVIVATIAFGMGIDKPDVRFVIHENIPKSLEGYYQETGRAGRDGLRAGCILFYNFADTVPLRKMIDEGDGTREVKERQHEMLRMMINYCVNNVDCRRVQILKYFSERFSSEQCQKYCDICRSSVTHELQDFTEYGQKAVCLVQRTCRTFRLTLKGYEDVFKGLKSKKYEQFRSQPEFGAGASLDKLLISRLFQQLMIDGVLIEDMHAKNGMGFLLRYIIPGPTAQSFLRGGYRLKISVETTPTNATKRTSSSRSVKTGTHGSPKSTNVSSPVVPPGQRTKSTKRSKTTIPVVVDDDSDAFEPLTGHQLPRADAASPALDTGKLGSLGNIEEAIVEEFLFHARQKCESISREHKVKGPVFKDTTLRAMATHFPETETEMWNYPDADWDTVRRYGKYFIPLIKNAKQHYDELKEMETPVLDPNHQNVIDISSDDDNAGNDGMEDFIADDDDVFDDYVEDDLNETGDETSPYFQPKSASRSSRSTDLQSYSYKPGSSRRPGAGNSRKGKAARRGGSTRSRRGASSSNTRRARAKPSSERPASTSRSRVNSGTKPARTSTIAMMPT